MSRIRVLPEAVASRIAAGEVVERPASVVKELVENALDAGARRVDVTLEEGGKRLIRVADDGCGMDRDDAVLAFSQHATSKIGADFDLAALASFGFRGEALAAIGACSRVTLVTAPLPGEGTRVVVEHGTLRDVSAVGAPQGTSVEVTGLFSALPARRKFLRSAATESSHAARFLEQQSVSRPDVHLTLAQGRTLLDLAPVQSRRERLVQWLGRQLVDEAVEARGERDGVRVEAWLLRSGSGPGRLAGLTLLVNGRAVTDRLLAHALREAGRQLFGEETGVAGVLVVDLPPHEVDVNVHPGKREVRFARPSQVHDAVRELVRAQLTARRAFAPGLDRLDAPSRLSGWSPAADLPPPAPGPAVAEPLPLPGAARPSGRPWASASPASPFGQGLRVLGQHRNTYAVVEDEQGLVIVDQHCAHERILFERVMDGLAAGAPRQALLVPVVVEMPVSALEALRERLPELAALGFEVEPFGDAAVAVRAVPEAAGQADPAELLRELAAQDLPGSEPVARVEKLAATVACKAAVKAGFVLGAERLRHIVEELFRARVPTTCPHGRVALLRITDRDLDHRFGRP